MTKAERENGEFSNEAEIRRTKAEGGESGEGTESGGEERKFLNKAERESEGREAESRNRKRRGSGKPLKQSGRERRSEEERRVSQARLIKIQFPVVMARGSHLFPYRTQKLSLSALMVLGWKRPGRVGRRRIPLKVLVIRLTPFHFIYQ